MAMGCRALNYVLHLYPALDTSNFHVSRHSEIKSAVPLVKEK